MNRRAAWAALLAVGIAPAPPAIRAAEAPGTNAAPAAVVVPDASGSAREDLPDDLLSWTIEETVLIALRNNRDLRIERMNPLIARTAEQKERAAFDPVFRAEWSAARNRELAAGGTNRTSDATAAGVGVAQALPIGTRAGVDLKVDEPAELSAVELDRARAILSIEQPLLRGAGTGPVLAAIRQARIDTRISEYELRGFAEDLVARVETAYWEYVLAIRQIGIYEASSALAAQQMEEAQHRVRVGGLAESELAAAQAEVALRREALINARSRADALRVQILRLACPAGLGGRVREIRPASRPAAPAEGPDSPAPLAEHALRMRPDLNQARLARQRGALDVVRTRNGLLPKLDLFVSLGRTGYARSFADAVSDLDGEHYETEVGVRLELPPLNRAARADRRRAELSLRQADEALDNFSDLVRADVETAYIEVRRTREQMAATSATRALQEEKLRGETAKFRLGKSTSLAVAQVQRDLLASQTGEIEAVVRHLQGLVALYRVDGSLLFRRGIEAPGAEPVDAPASDARPSHPRAATPTGDGL